MSEPTNAELIETMNQVIESNRQVLQNVKALEERIAACERVTALTARCVKPVTEAVLKMNAVQQKQLPPGWTDMMTGRKG